MKKIMLMSVMLTLGLSYTIKVEARELILTKSNLKTELAELKKELDEQPQDAKIDPVWKAVPGYNGQEVNIEKSYEKLKSSGEIKKEEIVVDERRPTVHLRDLPPTPIYRGNESKNMVALTINVAKGWKDNSVEMILETLKKEKVHVTFFLEGQWAAENPTLVKRMIDNGHEVGNHTYQHADPAAVSIERLRSELQRTSQAIENVTKKKVIWFAPPSGSYDDEAVKEAFRQGMWTVMWSVDTVDWKRPPAHIIVERVQSKVHPGAIILMHPTKPTSEAMERMIQVIRNKSLEMGTLSQLVDEKRLH